MGAGKSTVGRMLADRTRRAFVDVDLAIVARTGKTVRELWEAGGEAAYRRLESEEVVAVIDSEVSTVLAAPAGVILDPVVRYALRRAFVVWLRAEPATLAGRVHPGDHRPLLGDDPFEVLEAMAEQRSGLYQEVADAVVDTGAAPPEAATQVIIGELQRAGIA